MERRAHVGGSRVEALELGVEVLAVEVHQRGRERLVEGVEPEHPGVLAERVRHVAPYLVVLALQVAHDVVPPEVAERDAGGAGAIFQRPAAGWVHARHPVGADGPVRRTLALEHLAVDVLVHVEDGVDVEPRQQVDRGAQVVDVAVQHGLVELVRVAGGPVGADGRVVGGGGARLQPAPGHAEPHHVEAQPRHQRGVGDREVPRLALVGVELIRRVLVDGIDAVEEDDAARAVVEIGPAGRRDPARDGGGAAGAVAGCVEDRRGQRGQGVTGWSGRPSPCPGPAGRPRPAPAAP